MMPNCAKTIPLYLILTLLGSFLWAGHDGHDHEDLQQTLPTPAPFQFIQNQNQWPDQVKYKVELPGGALYLENNLLTYDFFDHENLHDRLFHPTPESEKITTLKHHAFKIYFENANTCNIVPDIERSEKRNYFLGNDPGKWATDVPAFEKITYADLYPGIDMVYYSREGGLKYDFVMRSGGDPADIRMRYDGVNKLSVNSGNLIIKTSINKIVEQKPYAYQVINGTETEVACEFVVKDRTVTFDFPEGYNENEDLIIDPTLIFSTYTGSTSDNWGFTATYDGYGNHYAGGIVFGGGYPVTTGAYQTTFGQGGRDVSISKFSSDGTQLLYATYLGGNAEDQPHSLVVNDNDELVIFGRTRSTNFPVSTNAYDPTHNGGYDLFVTKLSSNGNQLLGSTYIGGATADGLNISVSGFSPSSLRHNYGDDARGEVITDQLNDIYVAACTQSNNFPTTTNAYQTQFGGGNQDGCVFKLSDDLTTLMWSTFLGGSDHDACYSIDLADGNIPFVAGGTRSNNYVSSTNAIWSQNQGGIDGFITKLAPNGQTVLASTYIGTNQYDQTYFVKLDRNGNVYMVGQSEGNIPVTPGVYNNPNSGQFIMKVTPDLTTIMYSTVFGSGRGAPDISPTAFLVDVCNYVYVSGWGGSNVNYFGSTNGLPVTPDAFKPTTDGNDLYIIVLQDSGLGLEYASFYGGNQSNEHVDGGTSRFNKQAVIYQSVCAGCGGNDDFPFTAGAYSWDNRSFNCNLGAFKMEFNLPGIAADFNVVPRTSGCAPLDLDFINNSLGGVQFIWDFGDGSANATTYNADHVFNTPGFYTVKLYAIDSASCNIIDSASRVIQVLPQPNVQAFGDTVLCPGEPTPLNASGALSYSWSAGNRVSNPNVANPVATVDSTTTLWVYGTNGFGCTDSASVTITTHPRPQANGGPDRLLCPDSSARLNGSGGLAYSWSPPTGLSCTNCPNPIATPGSSTINYILTITDANGCQDQDTVIVRVTPTAAFAGPDLHFCSGEDTILRASGGILYEWNPPFGLSNTSISNPLVSFPNDTSVTYGVTVTSPLGCPEVDSVTVTRHPLPNADAGPDTVVCLLDSLQLNASGGVSYQWFPTGTMGSSNVGNPFVSPSSLTTYYVTVADQYGCESLDSVNVDVLPRPQAVAIADQVICQDSSVQLTSSGGIRYSWSPPGGLSDPTIADPVASPGSSTQYIVTAIATNNCEDTDTVNVTVIPTPVVDAGPDVFICLGFPITLTASGAQSYLWSTGDTDESITLYPQDTTEYYVTGWVDGCPSLPDTVRADVDTDLPNARFLAIPDSGWVGLDVQFLDASYNSNSWQWDFGDGSNGSLLQNPRHFYSDTGHFPVELIVTSANGCQDTAYKEIIVEASFTMFIPSGFTPNGDGINDNFTIGWTGVKDFEIRIYSRWGLLMYRSTDPNFAWPGTYQGGICPEGVYTYVAVGKGYLGEKKERAGTITLVR